MRPMSSLSPALRRDRLIRRWYGGGPSKACRRASLCRAAWSVDEVMAIGDEATQTHVLSTLYAKMKAAPAPADMPEIFRELGVSEHDGKLVFDAGASLATIRRRITESRDDSVAQ